MRGLRARAVVALRVGRERRGLLGAIRGLRAVDVLRDRRVVRDHAGHADDAGPVLVGLHLAEADQQLILVDARRGASIRDDGQCRIRRDPATAAPASRG